MVDNNERWTFIPSFGSIHDTYIKRPVLQITVWRLDNNERWDRSISFIPSFGSIHDTNT